MLILEKRQQGVNYFAKKDYTLKHEIREKFEMKPLVWIQILIQVCILVKDNLLLF